MPGVRHVRPTPSTLNPLEVDHDLSYLNSSKDRFCSADAWGDPPSEGMQGERERPQRGLGFDTTWTAFPPSASIGMNQFGGPPPGEDMAPNGWANGSSDQEMSNRGESSLEGADRT
ncbi:hypothetical protein M422DRAFT_270349 [Sphaerobolus stellatus SS14]|uniref:Uncharacterized protein n=1 Tax=Sphaerobolus stellatus (strain SS14) TaxID=990650 RepID=A0A0C9USN6_SPHS4|nr:hypothetical protein M422DRAFT_270349 [Sphaerobolus stellatus SS14]